MANNDDSSRRRSAPPPFAGPPRTGPLAAATRPARPTLPPFSPPFVRRPTPSVAVREKPPEAGTLARSAATETGLPLDPVATSADTEPVPNAPAGAGTTTPEVIEPGISWVDPDAAPPLAPEQAATGIEWLDSPPPVAERAEPTSVAEDDDVFGWDPAEEATAGINTAPSAESLDALKELEPWALGGVETPSPQDVATTLERIAARIRSGDVVIPGAEAAGTDEAALALVLAALLQRSRG